MKFDKHIKIRPFQDVTAGNLIAVSLHDSELFFALKGVTTPDQEQGKTSCIINIGPAFSRYDEFSCPNMLNESVLQDRLVMEFDEQIKLIPSLKPQDIDGYNGSKPKSGEIVFVEQGTYMTFQYKGHGLHTGYINIETGELIFDLNSSSGLISKRWELVILANGYKEVIYSFQEN